MPQQDNLPNTGFAQRQPESLALKAGRIVVAIVTGLLASIGGLVGVLLLCSYPGKPQPFVDNNGRPLPGSLSEKVHVNINGVDQGMFIKSKDIQQPVLLFVHGGPGMPTYVLTPHYPTDLEDYFTVCWWEQRGAGLSYSASIPPETMTVEQFVSDTLEVTNYLRNRFGKDKIYLMGHSWGTFIGIQAVAQAPQLYHAYMGMSQVTYQLQSEQLAYEYMLEQFKADGNTRMARKLEAASFPTTVPLPDAYDALRDEAMHSLGIGTTHDMRSVVNGIFVPSWLHREYTLSEKFNLWRGKFSSKRILWDKALATDLTKQVTEIDVPVYFFHGLYDYTANYTLARAYFEQLRAPLKGFYTFEQSAHSPILEEPAKARRILQEDVLAGKNSLADLE